MKMRALARSLGLSRKSPGKQQRVYHMNTIRKRPFSDTISSGCGHTKVRKRRQW